MSQESTFADNLMVYVCPHVLDTPQSTTLVFRDEDGDWQFLCEDESCPEHNDPKLINIKQLLEAERSIGGLSGLGLGEFAQRHGPEDEWQLGEVE